MDPAMCSECKLSVWFWCMEATDWVIQLSKSSHVLGDDAWQMKYLHVAACADHACLHLVSRLGATEAFYKLMREVRVDTTISPVLGNYRFLAGLHVCSLMPPYVRAYALCAVLDKLPSRCSTSCVPSCSTIQHAAPGHLHLTAPGQPLANSSWYIAFTKWELLMYHISCRWLP